MIRIIKNDFLLTSDHYSLLVIYYSFKDNKNRNMKVEEKVSSLELELSRPFLLFKSSSNKMLFTRHQLNNLGQ